MRLDDYLRSEVTEIENCQMRGTCPLGKICGTPQADGEGEAPLFPTIINVEKDERLWTDMRFEQRVFVLRKGAYVCMAHDELDRELPFSIYGAGIVVGLAEVYLPRKAAEYYHLKAIVPGSVCSLSTKAVRKHLEALSPAYQQEIINNVLTNQVASILAQVKMTSKQSYRDRVLFLLLRLYDLSRNERDAECLRITHGEIATLIGADRITATRALHKARDEGYVELGYATVTLTEKLLCRHDLLKDAHSVFYPVNDPATRAATGSHSR